MLRFSRLFKPKKSSQLPNVWKNIKTKRQIKRQIDTIDDNSSYDSKGQILCLEYGLLPETKLIYSDDEVVFYFVFYQTEIIILFLIIHVTE